MHINVVPTEVRGLESPGTGVRVVCELPQELLGTEFESSAECYVLLTAGPSF